MNSLFTGLALTAALLATAGGAGAAAAAKPQTTSVVVTDADRAEFRKAIAGNEMFVLLMKEFPAQYAAFETQLLADDKAGALTAASARDRISTFIAGIQRDTLPFSRKASDADITMLYARNLEVVKTLQRFNYRACYQFAGGSGLAPEVSDSLPQDAIQPLGAYAVFELKVAIVGRKTNVPHKPLAAEEFGPIIQAFVARGGDVKYLTVSGGQAGDMTPEERCRNAILWKETIVAQPPAMVGRIANTD